MEMSAEKLILIATSISLELAQDKSNEELFTYKNLFNAISNNLGTILAQRSNCKKKAD